MKKTYIKPQLCVVATNAEELLTIAQTSWGVGPHDEDKDNHGNIIYDDENFKDSYDPWNDSNW